MLNADYAGDVTMTHIPCASAPANPMPRAATALILTLAIASTIAQRAPAQASSNFGVVTLSAATRLNHPPIEGYTQGSVPLASIAMHDRAGNRCVGFAATEPDHLLSVEQNLGQLVLRVNSQGQDTTLLVQDADGNTWCGDDTGRSADATVRINQMGPGDYRVWVGSFDAGQRYDYTLEVQ